METPTLVIRHSIKASTVVKVVVVGTVAAYFARNLVRVIDETIDGINITMKQESDKRKRQEEK